jgi:hypothetical protein
VTKDAGKEHDKDSGGSSKDSDSGGSAKDSGSSEDSGSGSACVGPDAGGKAYTGIVELGLGADPAAPTQFGALAEFTPGPAAPACTGTMTGACCYRTVESTTVPTAESAGALTISDGATALTTLMSPDYATNSMLTPALTWAPGDTLNVVAKGDTVDAFTATIVAPALLAGLSPAFTTATLDVSLSKDYVVSWKPGTESCSEVTFGLNQGTGLPTIGCVADDSAGTLTVPASLLGMLTGTTGTATIERVEPLVVLATNAGIKVVAINGHYASVNFTP